MALNDSTLNAIRAKINTVFAEIEKEYGVSCSLGRIGYTSEKFSSKLTGIAVGDFSSKQEAVEDLAKKEFIQKCYIYGLSFSDFGRWFKCQGEELKITGINSRNRKSPILCVSIATGKRYKVSAQTAIFGFTAYNQPTYNR